MANDLCSVVPSGLFKVDSVMTIIYLLRLHFIPLRRLDVEEVADEEVVAFVLAIAFAHGVMDARKDDEFEVLAGTDEGISDLHGAGRIDIVVKFTNDEHQRALELRSVVDIAALYVRGVNGISHPLLIPPDLVHAVVMAAARGIGSLVEVAMQEDGGSGLLTTCGSTEDTYVVGIHKGVFLGSGTNPSLAVGEASILEVLIAHLLELLATPRGAHAVELYDDETKLSQWGHIPVEGLEGLRRIGIARTGIDVLDDGVFLRRVEIGGTLDDAPHRGFAIAARGDEDFRSLPAKFLEFRNVGRFYSGERREIGILYYS